MKLTAYFQYVEYAITKNIYANSINTYFNWQHRSTLARFLFLDGQLAPAIELFKSIIDVHVDEKNEMNNCPSELEIKIWCMKELGMAVWSYEENAQEALKYIDMAINLMNTSADKFYFISRGEVWRVRWDIFQSTGYSNFAVEEITEKISSIIPKGNSNSIYYYGFSFLADVAKRNKNIRKASRLLRSALRYFPHDKDSAEELNAICNELHRDPNGAYYKLSELTHRNYLIWDDN